MITGKVFEHLVPLSACVPLQSEGRAFHRQPGRSPHFEGLDVGELQHVVFLEVKTGKSALTKREKQIRDAIENGRVKWKELRVGQEVEV